MMETVSLFAGIGGIDIAFQQAGAHIAHAVEMDPHACRTYRWNLPHEGILHECDVRGWSVPSMERMDILTAGFPCQPFSIAGRRKGFEDDRGTMFFEVMRIIGQERPRAVFLENVKNLYTHDDGVTYAVMRDLLEMSGYKVTEAVLDTQEYGNLPQHRERLYIVAFRDGDDMSRFSFPWRLERTVELCDVLDDRADDGFYYTEGSRYHDLFDEKVTDQDSVYRWFKPNLKKVEDNVCCTLTAYMGTGGNNVPIIRDTKGVRKITPKECLRLQGFPDWYSFPNMSVYRMYAQIGNSVSVPVVRRIAERMIGAMSFDNVKSNLFDIV